jgi:hypothetical protein
MDWRTETSSRSHRSIRHCKTMSNYANRCRLTHSECSAFATRHCWHFSQLQGPSEVTSKSFEGSIPAANRCLAATTAASHRQLPSESRVQCPPLRRNRPTPGMSVKKLRFAALSKGAHRCAFGNHFRIGSGTSLAKDLRLFDGWSLRRRGKPSVVQ